MPRSAKSSPPIHRAPIARTALHDSVRGGALVLALVALAGCVPQTAPGPSEPDAPPLKSIDVTFAGSTGTPDPLSTSGEVPGFRDSDGYTYDISFRLVLSDVKKDIAQSSPGRAQITFAADFSAGITNTSEGRAAPLGNLRTFGVGAAFPIGSTVCGDAPGNIWEPSEGALGAYCLLYFIPTFLPETGVESGATYNASKVVDLAQENTEANVDVMVTELTAGPAFWLASDSVEPGLVSSCDGGPGSRIVWMSSNLVKCPGAVVAPAPVAIDTSADLAGGADAGFDQTIEPFYASGTGELASCPLGDMASITSGLAGAIEAGHAFSNITVSADKDPAARTEILCDSDQLRFMVLQRVADKEPLADFVADGDALSAEFPYLGGTLAIWCADSMGNCHPVWYSDHLVIIGTGGAVDQPQAQLDWFVKDLPAMLTNMAAPTT